MSITKTMPLNWYSSMKKNCKIWIIFDMENWLWKSEIGIFRSFDLERMLIWRKILFMKKCYSSLNKATIWCASWSKILKCCLICNLPNEFLDFHGLPYKMESQSPGFCHWFLYEENYFMLANYILIRNVFKSKPSKNSLKNCPSKVEESSSMLRIKCAITRN